MSAKKKLRLKVGEILFKISSLTPEQLEDALNTWKEKESAKLLGEILVSKGYVKQEDVETALAIQYGYPYILLSNFRIGAEICKILPREFVERHKIVPLEKMGNVMTAATCAVFDRSAAKEIEEKFGYKLRVFFASLKDIEDAIRRYY
jgi:type IV pilus assembly protein PilB